MALDAVSELGSTIGKLSNNQIVLEQNISPDESAAIDNVVSFAEIIVEGTVKGTAKYYDTTSFIIDHVLLGDIDSSTLLIDGGYAPEGITIPVTIPIEFEQDVVLFTVTL